MSLGNTLFFLIVACALSACGSQPQSSAPSEPAHSVVPAEPVKVVGDGSSQKMSSLPDRARRGTGAAVVPEKDYVIGPADELEIAIFQVEELSGVEKVNSRGYIRMPLLGPVKVAGLTRQQAEKLIADLYAADYLQDPQVNIDITEFASRKVTIIGAIERPGVYPLKGQTTLLEVLAMAGGLARLADDDAIVVFRNNAEGEVIGYVVNLNDITSGAKRDPKVIGNDSIVVPESGSRSMVQGVTDTLRGFIGFERY